MKKEVHTNSQLWVECNRELMNEYIYVYVYDVIYLYNLYQKECSI